jgi:hypothetical protein
VHHTGEKSLIFYNSSIPVYGWTSMNYPGNLQGSLLDKYESQRKEREAKNSESPNYGSMKKRISSLAPKFITEEFPDREERMKQRMLNRK